MKVTQTNTADFSSFEVQLMRQLLKESEFYKGKTKPNPVVAAAVYSDHTLISKGFHVKAGLEHAEIQALRKAGSLAKGAQLMITLEPCTHFGKTPPCVDFIVQSGISSVVFSTYDPNPKMQQRAACDILEQAGISVRVGLCASEARELNRYYYYFHEHKRPFVIMKAAMSLDGKIALANGKSKYLTSEASLAYVHQLRSQVDAVLVGKQTVLMDNPLLTVRHESVSKDIVQPYRFVIGRHSRFDANLKLFQSVSDSPVCVFSTDISERLDFVNYHKLSSIDDIDWTTLFRYCYQEGISSILLEGGTTLFSSAISNQIVNQLLLFYAPKLIGEADAKSLLHLDSVDSLDNVITISDYTIETIGQDFLMNAFLK